MFSLVSLLFNIALQFNVVFQLFRDMGITKNLGEKIEEWNYSNFNESERIAELIKQKLNR